METSLDSNKNVGQNINRYCLSLLQNNQLYKVQDLKNPKLQDETFSDNHLKETSKKMRKLGKSCTHKQNINGIYIEKLHNSCLQILPTLRLKTQELRKLGNSDEKNRKAQTTAQYPVLSLKTKFHSYLIENSQIATLNFPFKSRFSVKPSKFQIQFAKDCLRK